MYSLSMPPRGPGTRAGLTRDAVLAAARELLASDGLDALTMRALARRLDVAPNALYSHVANKTALVDALLDDLLDGVAEPAVDAPDPIGAVAALMRSSYDVLLTRPDLVPLYLARQGSRGPRARRLGVVTDALLARAGVAAGDAPTARRALIVHAIGSAAFAAGSGQEVPAAVTREAFERSLGWLLAGMAGRRQQGDPAAVGGRGTAAGSPCSRPIAAVSPCCNAGAPHCCRATLLQ
jgi:TetR/AcrR family transcriptional regulator, tetracycline repressor protein